MSKLHFKGGPWTNAEDQVLKAALAQYGLRDWERVASMLTKKTSSQCRERWENYLDPRLNIREAWSLEEEEKLVELQSLFPNKFRLIAEQLTRRTSTHYIRPAWLCEQRYLELKDEQEHYIKQKQQQQQGEGDEAAKQSLEAFMAERRRRRNARKTHEERAARADTVSGERFQQEMVDMATSRLANQDQKKGLRKERQRQLEEAAFLAKLESNREGIESGTLSLRQSKKMRKALEEDRQSKGLVDLVVEDNEEEEGNDSEAYGEVQRAASNSSDEGHDSGFEAIDMYEDQQQAGLIKKQRVLMKDLTGQQRSIQQRQMQVDDDKEAEGGEGGGGSSSSSGSRARAALTGVNHDLLKQLMAGPSNKASSSTSAFIQDRPSLAKENAADAQSELKSTLADLFASLPQAQTTSSTSSDAVFPSHLPSLPPLKRPRDSLPSVSADDVLPSSTTAATAASGTLTASNDGNAISNDLFSSLNLPLPGKHAKTEVDRQARTHTDKAEKKVVQDVAPPLPIFSSSVALIADAQAPQKEVSSHSTLLNFSSAQEENAYVSVARQWVAVECEKVLTNATTYTNHAPKTELEAASSDTLSVPPLSSAEKDAVEKLVAAEMSNVSLSGADAVTAVRAYVRNLPHYAARVNVQNALHQLSASVAAEVREANALLQPLRQEWEQILSIAMLHPRELHVLKGYVSDDGRLKQPSGVEKKTNEFGVSVPASSVAAYVYEHLVNELTRAQQAVRFISSLRTREQLKMRRDLEAAELELQQLQARERTLQEVYRQKRVQQ